MAKTAELNLAQRARAKTKLSQRAFATLIGASHISVARWETGDQQPSGTARSLLRLIEARPRIAQRVLAEAD